MKKQSIKTRHYKTTCFWAFFLSIFVMACNANKSTNASTIDPEIVLTLAPGKDNPRNSEGDFVTLKDGQIMFIYSRYTGTSSSDHAPAYLAARYSNDNGQTWTLEDKVILSNEGGMNIMSVSLLRLKNGNIALFYLKKNSIEDCIPMMRISKDEGNSWSEPIVCITDKSGYFVLNNARVIQLEDGRLLMPVALHKTSNGEWKEQADLYCYYSEDNGNTWKSSTSVPNLTNIITQEPGVIELRDGRIMMYIRASGGHQQLSFSTDKGASWSHIESSNIASPISPATIEKIPGSDDWLLVWNNNDGSDAKTKGQRTPLTMAISKDEGKTWKKIKNIQEDPDGWYCYIAIRFIDNDNLLLGYCAGSQSNNTGLSFTNITRLNKQWIYK
ncbi:sialidase family protein [Massilibacteroides vaginae]|uniref:sialidase family protein n=1 Tax=Massilibacteroides vaginae TaxID=1673718 RepID=UPI000A1C9F8F|nr:sialidase family protein [Massilibacteroides vaginae]